MRTLKKQVALLGLPLVLLLTACGDKQAKLVLPPVERAEPVAFPVVPEGEAEGGAMSDRQNAELIDALATALDSANAKLLWFRDWISEAGD